MIRGRMVIIRIITFFRWGFWFIERFDFSINIVELNIFQKIIRYCVVVVVVVVLYFLILLQPHRILYYKM
jgi:hypothetical protein